MVDRELVEDRLLKLEDYISDLKEYQDIKLIEYQNDKLLRRFLERTLHLAIESCLDIGNHIISDDRLGIADSNAEIIETLAKHNIIKENKKYYIKMAKFRNVIVHDYNVLDDQVMIKIIQNNLGDLEQFLFWIKEYI